MPSRGLDEADAARLLAQYGPNALPARPSRSSLAILAGTLREPTFSLLAAAALAYLLLGDLGQGLFMVGGACLSLGLVVVQQHRSERALDALRDLAQPTCRVIRSGHDRIIAARDLVPGDIVIIGEGQRVPADCVHRDGDTLTVNESALTGEAATVAKRPADRLPSGGDPEPGGDDPEPGGDDSPYLFAGTLVTRGQAVAEVLRTGAATRLGRIGASLSTLEPEPTLLQKATARLVGVLAVLAIGFCAVVVVLYGLLRQDWSGGLLSGIALAIAMLPEEFPMVLAIFLAIGSLRLARRNVLVRRAAAIETLGAITVLCVDKTGTLTENRMRVSRLWLPDTGFAQPDDLPGRTLIATALLASAPHPIDPMDRAVSVAAAGSASASDGALIRTYPLTPDLLAFGQCWRQPSGDLAYAVKGAPEAILRLCASGGAAAEAAEAAVAELGNSGLRVLGCATCSRPAEDPAAALPGLPFRFLGLIAFEDPLRADVPQAIAEAERAGVRVVMITGDFPATARATATAAGLDGTSDIVTGAELTRSSAAALGEKLGRTRVFARIMPEQKLALVAALKAAGEIVAMTGDGVNDAPALRAANVGIAMGRRGTDVAREAADLVLLDDRFASIIGGISLGRRIFANLKKALTYVTAIHVPIAGLALLPLVFGLPAILLPVHVVLLELIIDPVCSLAFEAEPENPSAMRRPPRRAGDGLFGPREVALALVLGTAILAATGGIYALALSALGEAAIARGAALIALVGGNLVLAYAESVEPGTAPFDSRHRAFWAIAVTAAGLLAAIIAVPALAAIFAVAPPPPWLLGLALAAAVLAGGWIALFRRIAGSGAAGAYGSAAA